MYSVLQPLHSYLAYVLLAVLVIAIAYNGFSFVQGKKYSEMNKKMSLYGLIATHLQVFIGLILYSVSPLGMSNISKAGMKDGISRLYFMEHPLMMILAVVLVTIGYSKAKRLIDSDKKYRTMLAFYVIGLIFILSRIPWTAWLD